MNGDLCDKTIQHHPVMVHGHGPKLGAHYLLLINNQFRSLSAPLAFGIRYLANVHHRPPHPALHLSISLAGVFIILTVGTVGGFGSASRVPIEYRTGVYVPYMPIQRVQLFAGWLLHAYPSTNSSTTGPVL